MTSMPARVLTLCVVLLAACGSRDGARPQAATARPRGAVERLTNVPGTAVKLTAQRSSFTPRDGTPSPMWGFCETGSAACAAGWVPGPTIVATEGDALSIELTNTLKVPTSITILGQLGGGLGTPTKMDGPAHPPQQFTTFPSNGPADLAFTPPAQGQRMRSFGAEVPAATATAPSVATLTWPQLRPGTYLYEAGTLPSIEVPMGLYGVLVVKPAGAAAWDDEVALLFSEMDPAQNRAVDLAASAGAGLTQRFDDPACAPTCFPAAVNYSPTYFLINGQSFDLAAPERSAWTVGDTATYATGNVVLRLANAGSRSHVPAVVGLPMAILAEDGNPAPGLPRVENEVLLTAGKTLDVRVRPAKAAAGAGYAPATYAVFDRALALGADGHPDGGMQGFLLVDHAGAATTTVTSGGVTTTVPAPGAPGNLPAAVTPVARADAYKVPFNGQVAGDVTANDTGVARVAVAAAPGHGTLDLHADGTFTYRPATGFSGQDHFTYVGNGAAALTADVTLDVAVQRTDRPPVANADAYRSNLSTRLAVPRPGVLANDTDPSGFPLTAALVGPGSCASVVLQPDGSFTATGARPGCQFQYRAVNSQGTPSASPAAVSITFGAPDGVSGLTVSVVDASTGAAIGDYRWTLQEDLTFKHDVTATPSLSTRTLGTSFHRSHMPVVATGCVGPASCGSGQAVRGVVVTDAQALARQALPSDVVLDPTKHYYLSILPGDVLVDDAHPIGHAMGGAELHAGRVTDPVTVKLQATPLPTAQLSIFVYEDSNPTNGQNDIGEPGLGGFNVILMDPAGRTGDVAGQQSYDAFNMPLSNSLLGRPGCPDELNGATNGDGTSDQGNVVGGVYTCPNDPNEGTPAADPARYALAGHALIQNLTPARYDVIIHPGAARQGAGELWLQTETLEGTPAQDAFVGVNEPVYFQEFGPPGPHTTVGFVNPGHLASELLTGGATVSGRITNQHMSRPSDVRLWDSGSYDLLSSTTCEVVLNANGGGGPAIAAASCDADGNFSISGVPPGDYDLAVFDQWLDQIIQNVGVHVPPATPAVAMGDIPVLSWFTQWDQNIFQDLNGNGVYDDGEPGISNVPLTVRYRNGAPSNSTLTDSNGNGLLVELFPLFNWYVAEADTTRFKQTGVHVTVDGGGPVDPAGPGAGLWTSAYATGASSVRTERPGALSYGFQGFISQRNRLDWGRTPYVPGENGGIQGYVVYSSTRPFDDMRFNVQTLWEPLVPRVTVNLYRRETLADGTAALTLVDSTKTTSFDDFVNLVQGSDGGQWMLGQDGKLRDPATGAAAPAGVTAGRQVNLQCPGQVPTDPFVNYTLGTGDLERCYDGWHGWNQAQAAPYDGRYVFPSEAYRAAHPLTAAQQAGGMTLVSLPPGTYVVEMVPPPGYDVVKEEDKNIFLGDAFVGPAPQQFGSLGSIFILPDQATLGNANPYNPNTGDPGTQSDPTTNLGVYDSPAATIYPECVGNLHRVPDFLSLYPAAQQVAPFAGMDRPLCDRKQVVLSEGMQTSATFFVFTETPVASNNTGIILDDATAEFNAFAPDFGEKASVPFVPVSIKDWAGLEVSRTYSDQWGAYNMMTPSSFLVNPPTPSGYGPNMLITCINDPGPVRDPATGQLVVDPAYNPAYSNFCYTNPYMPGQTTYLDTPVLPIAAFAAGYNPADCAPDDATPSIQRVDSSAGFGPWLPGTGGTLTITAAGDVQVPNPAYAGPFATGGLAAQHTVTRHYGFGAARGRLSIGGTDLSARVTSWTDGQIVVTVPAGTPSGELGISTAGGTASIDTVTVTVGGRAPTRVAGGLGIQAAIDLASPGDLILVDAGVYDELVIMWKPVRLQGVGAASVVINAAKYPNSKLDAWRPRINALFAVDATTGNSTGPSQVDPLPTQEITGGVVILEPTVLGSEEGAGVTVLAKDLPASACGDVTEFGWESNFRCAESRIDGLSITGGDAGGGVYVNGWAHGLEISNNRVYGNAGAYNGGIRVGVPYLELDTLPPFAGGRVAGLGYDEDVHIHHNAVTKNGSIEAPAGAGGAGGGISICSGTDRYVVDHNFVCGNYSAADGGGIGHLGFSQGGTIAFNRIRFNQSFQQTTTTHGGGIFVGGEPPVAGALSLGTGDVTIDANELRGNLAEAGHGGGIRLQQVNGADVAASPGNANRWHRVRITNNVVADNVAGWAGGGVSLSDALQVTVAGNTIASNDSTGIAGVVLAGGTPLPAGTPGVAGAGYPSPSGLVAELTSAPVLAAMNGNLRASNRISSPALVDNVVWRNRAFYYSGDGRLCAGNTRSAPAGACNVLPDQAATGDCPAGARYWDLGVLGDASTAPSGTASLRLNPTTSILTSTSGYAASNSSSDPRLRSLYCNGARAVPELPSVINPPSPRSLQVAATVDEGNNFVNLRYGPLYTVNPVTQVAFGDWHLGASSPAQDAGVTVAGLNHDLDGDPRPSGPRFDIGADEVASAPADLSVTKTDGRTTVAPGTTGVTYTIVVSNAGPGAAAGATLTDSLPGGTRLQVTSWSCAAPAGGACTTSGTGNTTRGGTVSLPPGTSATFTLTGNVPAAAPGGASTNTVTVTSPSDPNPANNTASDTDQLVRGAVTFGPASLGTLSATTLAFGNLSGPQASTLTVNVATAPVTFTAANVTNLLGSAFSKTGDTCTGATVPAGGTCSITIQFVAPAGTAARLGGLTVTDNGTGSPQVLVLTGS